MESGDEHVGSPGEGADQEPPPEEPAQAAPETGPLSEVAFASQRIAEIVATAESTAEQVRAEAERRADERIAEADRAAEYRVQAAEVEADEVTTAAHIEADQIRRAAAGEIEKGQAEAEQLRRAAAESVRDIETAARAEAERLRDEADVYANDIRAAAEAEARELTREARSVAGEALKQGTELSSDLEEMGVSLRRNAERLLRDMRDAHSRLTANLDRTVGAAPPERARRRRTVDVDDDFEIPEFLPDR